MSFGFFFLHTVSDGESPTTQDSLHDVQHVLQSDSSRFKGPFSDAPHPTLSDNVMRRHTASNSQQLNSNQREEAVGVRREVIAEARWRVQNSNTPKQH